MVVQGWSNSHSSTVLYRYLTTSLCLAGMRWPSWRYSVDSRLFVTTYSRKKPLCITPTSARIWRSHQVHGGQESKYQEAPICEAGKWGLGAPGARKYTILLALFSQHRHRLTGRDIQKESRIVIAG